MNLNPGEAIILFIRRSDRELVRYMVDIRKAETTFDARNDLKVDQHQVEVSSVGEFDDLAVALSAGSERLKEIA